jgi:hypothetical protein
MVDDVERRPRCGVKVLLVAPGNPTDGVDFHPVFCPQNQDVAKLRRDSHGYAHPCKTHACLTRVVLFDHLFFCVSGDIRPNRRQGIFDGGFLRTGGEACQQVINATE